MTRSAQIAQPDALIAKPDALIAKPWAFARWPDGMKDEMLANRDSPIVLLIQAGRRCTFHCHVLDYFWTCHAQGRARNYYEHGSIFETTYTPGATQHATYALGERMVHAVENIGTTDLLFTTVEYLHSANAPRPVQDRVRLHRAS